MSRIANLFRAAAVLALLAPAACSATADDKKADIDESSNIGAYVRADVSHLRGLNMDPRFGRPGEAGHASIDQLRYLGVGRVRVHPKVLEGETFDSMLATYRDILAGYRAAGIEVLVVINEETVPGAGPGRIGDWARNDPGAWNNYVQMFADASAAFAAAAGEGVSFEIWNEPDDLWQDDGGEGWFEGEVKSKHLYPSQFAQIVTAATQAIHGVSGARVLSGGVSSGKPEYLARTGAFEADGVAIHFYNIWAGNDVSEAPGGPWFNVVKNKVAEYGGVSGGRALYLTEWGTQQIGHDGTRDLIRAFFEDEAAASFAEAYFFSWCDCQDPVAQSLTTNGSNAYQELWRTWREASGVADMPMSLGSRCLPEPSMSCEYEGDAGCGIASNFVCERDGNGACGGVGPQTADCNHCCEVASQAAPPEPPPPEPPPGEPPPETCYCEGYNENNEFVQTYTCNDVTCSIDGQLWICLPGSVDYQPTGDFASCSGG